MPPMAFSWDVIHSSLLTEKKNLIVCRIYVSNNNITEKKFKHQREKWGSRS